MKLDAFVTLEAVIRHGTLSAAAAERHLTPGAVSMQMKQLEAYFGQPLFDRSGQQLRPMALAQQASRVMSEALLKIEGLREVSHLAVRGVVKLGVLESMLPALLPPTIAYARDRHPGLEIQLVSGRTVSLTAAVKAGELDAALVARPEDGGSTRLLWYPIDKREAVLIAPPDSAETTLAEMFRNHEWIRYDRDTIAGRLAKRYVESLQVSLRVSREFDSAAAIVAMVSAGLGVSVLEISEPAVLLAYPVRAFRLKDAPAYQLALTVRKSDGEKRALTALREALQYAVSEANHRRLAMMMTWPTDTALQS